MASSHFNLIHSSIGMRPSRILAIAASLCTASAAATKPTKKFLFTGTNQAGGEFGNAIPGELGRDYIWPDPKSINVSAISGFTNKSNEKRL